MTDCASQLAGGLVLGNLMLLLDTLRVPYARGVYPLPLVLGWMRH